MARARKISAALGVHIPRAFPEAGRHVVEALINGRVRPLGAFRIAP